MVYIFDDDLIMNLSEYNPNNLKKLVLHWQEKHPLMATLSFKNLTKLTHITLRDIKFADAQMQEICEHLKHLRVFVLAQDYNYKKSLTDFGFTGETANTQTGFSISNLKHLKMLHIEMEDSCLGEPTLLNIMKIKGLEYLYISCEEKMSVSCCTMHDV